MHAPHVVDNARFAGERERLAGARAALMTGFGLDPAKKVVLYCSKFMAKKQPLMLVDAFLNAELGGDWVLLMVGEGELRAAAEARAHERGATTIHFAGFLDQSEVGRGYGVADILVLPSAYQETWGLVIYEAMNFGCPVIVSDQVSCGPNLVADKCGLIFPYRDRAALMAALRRLAGDDAFRAECRQGALDTIASWSVRDYMTGLRRALGPPAAAPDDDQADAVKAA